MYQHFNLGSINFSLKDPEKSVRAEKYYVQHKKDLTEDIISQLNKRICSNVKKLTL